MIEHLFLFWIAIDRPYKVKLRRMNGVIMVNTASIKSVFKYNDTKLHTTYNDSIDNDNKKNGTYLSQHRHPHIDYHICSIYIPFFIRGWIKKTKRNRLLSPEYCISKIGPLEIRKFVIILFNADKKKCMLFVTLSKRLLYTFECAYDPRLEKQESKSEIFSWLFWAMWKSSSLEHSMYYYIFFGTEQCSVRFINGSNCYSWTI